MALPRARLLGLLRLGIALVILAAVAWAVARNWAAVSADLGKVTGWALVVALVLAVVGPILTMLGWRVLMTDLGSPMHVAPAGGIFFIGQLGKYLPGSVWSVLAQAEMGAKLHIPRRRSAVVGLISIGLGVLTGLLVGVAALPLLLHTSGSGHVGWLVLALPLLVVACWPRLLNRLIALGLRLLHREPLEHELSGRAVLTSVVLFVGAWLCFGVHVWVLATSIGGANGPASLALASVAGYALAASLGMLAVIAPAGVGIREALLVLMLGQAMPTSAATAVVLLSRFIITAGDVLVAGGGWLYARSHHLVSAHPGQGAPAAPDPVTHEEGRP
ncbi:MAG: lysylphosphatidylglycerol synthase domain-containing protein [Oryzihumus sp.]